MSGSMDRIQRRLEHFEAKSAIRDDLIDILDQAFQLIPVGQLEQGYTWVPSPEAVVLLKIAKDRLREHKELDR